MALSGEKSAAICSVQTPALLPHCLSRFSVFLFRLSILGLFGFPLQTRRAEKQSDFGEFDVLLMNKLSPGLGTRASAPGQPALQPLARVPLRARVMGNESQSVLHTIELIIFLKSIFQNFSQINFNVT